MRPLPDVPAEMPRPSLARMSALPEKASRGLTRFDPSKAKVMDAKLTAVIEYAKLVKDWVSLVDAIAEQLLHQDEVVRWWEEVVGRAGGDRQSEKHSRRSALMLVDDAESLTGITQQQVSRWRRRLQNPEKYRAMLYGATWRKAMAEGRSDAQLLTQSDSFEWYTPGAYIESARAVLGGIDLDPASCELANMVIKAAKLYTKEDDGLVQDWHAKRLWLNPPYGKTCRAFVAKLCLAYENKEVEAAILLVNSNSTDTDWFSPLWRQLLCFTNHRINFYSGECVSGNSGSTHGSCFVYFGAKRDLFAQEFGKHGAVVQLYDYKK